ncbi:N-acetyltransferase family protein [Sphingomonas sp. DT-204]|uniref:GNAT family N-acetyltransferase n=1 Tax=Sphingomonas sp. DT-204 TaxID=3396166 RepID=UPI003F1942CA
MTLHFRLATAADLPAIVGLLADDVNGAQREDASLPLDPGYTAAFAAIEADPNQELIVAEQDGRIVGTLQLSFLPGLSFKGAWRGQIEAVRIAGDLRGQGLGGEMIRWAVERCRQRGCRMVQLTSQNNRPEAHRFYEKLGWQRTHAGFKLNLTEDR